MPEVPFPESVAVTLVVADALERLGVPYLIGGSVASTVHGVLRSTLDADLVADLHAAQAAPLAEALAGAFYVDAQSIQDAIARRGSFNVIHLETMFKVDIFVTRGRPFDQSQFERRAAVTLAAESDRTAFVASPEDVILAKLEWYRDGGSVSDRQWRDILGVLMVQAGRLDLDYLRHWAAALGVSQLLEQALTEST